MNKFVFCSYFVVVLLIQSIIVRAEENAGQFTFDFDPEDWNEGYKFFSDNIPEGYSTSSLSMRVEGRQICSSEISVLLNANLLDRSAGNCVRDEANDNDILEFTVSDLLDSYQYTTMNFIQIVSNSEAINVKKMQVTFQITEDSISRRSGSCPDFWPSAFYNLTGCIYPLTQDKYIHAALLFKNYESINDYQVSIIECTNFGSVNCKVIKDFSTFTVVNSQVLIKPGGCGGINSNQPCVRSYLIRSFTTSCRASTATLAVPNKKAAEKNPERCRPPSGLSTGITSKDLSTGVTSIRISTGITSKDLSTGVTSKDLSTGVTSKDLSTGITSKDLSTGVTSKDLSTGVTSKDLSTGVTSKDLSTGVTSKDLSTGVTSKDLSTGVTSKQLSTGVTSKDLSTGVTSKDLSTGVTSGVTSGLSTGVTSDTGSLTTKSITTKSITTRGLTTRRTDCVTGLTEILMGDGISVKFAKDIVKGDIIMGLGGPSLVAIAGSIPQYVGKLVGFNDEEPFFTGNHPWVLPHNSTFYQSFDAETVKRDQPDTSVVSMKAGSKVWKLNQQSGESEAVTINKFNVVDIQYPGIEVFSFVTINRNVEFESYYTNGYASTTEGGRSLPSYVSSLASQYVVSKMKDLLLGKFSEYSSIHPEITIKDYIDTISKPTHQQQHSIIKQHFPEVAEDRQYSPLWYDRIFSYIAVNSPTDVDWHLARVIPTKLTLSFLENIHPDQADIFLYETLLPQVRTMIEQQIELLSSKDSNLNRLNGGLDFQFCSI